MSNITIENWECARGEQPRRPRGPKPVAQGQWLKTTAWLDGEFFWRDGALNWRWRGQILALDAVRIAQAGRALDKLEAHDFQRATVLHRREKWELVRKLGEIQAFDLDKLCAVSRRRNPAALQRLAPLLVLESLGVGLPQSPARALISAWPHSQSALEFLLADETWPREARELVAFILGACAPATIAHLPRLWRGVAASGARFQIELQTFEAPALLWRAWRQDEALVGRILVLKQSQSPFAPDVVAMAHLAKHGLERGIEIGEQLANVGELWPELPLCACRDDAHNAEITRQANVLWRRARRDWQAQCRALLPAIAAHHPLAIEPFLRLCRELLGGAEALLSRPKRGRRSLRRLPPMSADAALFCAQVNACAARKIIALGRRALAAPDAREFLELWRETAHEQFGLCAGPRYAADDARLSQRWFGALMREIEEEFEPLLRLSNIGGGDFARTIWKRGHHHQLGRALATRTQGMSAECLQSWVQMVSELPIRSYSLRRWGRLWSKFDDGLARQIMPALVRATRGAPDKARAAMMSGILMTMPSRSGAGEVWPHLPELLREFAPMLGELEVRAIVSASASLRQMAALCHRFEIPRANWPLLVRALLEVRASIAPQDSDECEQICEIVARVCLACATDDSAQLEARLRATLRHALILLPEITALENALPGARVAQGRPQLARALRWGLEVAPARTLTALEHLAALENMHQLDALRALEIPAPTLNAVWNEIAALSPAIGEIARETASWQTLAQQENAPPPGAQKILDWPRKWAREIEALQTRVGENPNLEQRLENLRARLANELKWRAQQADEIGELLKNARKRAAFAALERAIESAFRARLESLCGALPDGFAFDENWFNALLLGGDVEYNRKWARALLRHEVAGRADWRQNLPGNARFLENLRARGVDVNFYGSEFGRSHGELWLWIENAPLHILQMGNRFNTCLSRGGCNAFAGVANAIELNKRVVYARDKKGHIVARQLWAISEEFKLVGFDVYSTYDAEKRAGLEAIFAAHARQWARGCGLELADAGEIEKLVAPQWYDDGVRAWETEPQLRRPKANASESPLPKSDFVGN